MTRGDAEKLLSDLVKRGRKQTDTLLSELERLVKQARKEVGGRAEPVRTVRKQATQAARRAAQETRLGMEQATGAKPAARGPRRGETLEVEIDSLAFGGRGVARAEGFVVFVAGALPGRPGPGRGDESEEALRRGADGRVAARPAPTASPTAASTAASPAPAPPGRASPTSASWPTRGAGRRGAAPDRRPRGLRAGGDRRRRASSGATATSSNTPSARATASRSSASTPAAAGT